jgi:hypothetical protein
VRVVAPIRLAAWLGVSSSAIDVAIVAYRRFSRAAATRPAAAIWLIDTNHLQRARPSWHLVEIATWASVQVSDLINQRDIRGQPRSSG